MSALKLNTYGYSSGSQPFLFLIFTDDYWIIICKLYSTSKLVHAPVKLKVIFITV